MKILGANSRPGGKPAIAVELSETCRALKVPKNSEISSFSVQGLKVQTTFDQGLSPWANVPVGP